MDITKAVHYGVMGLTVGFYLMHVAPTLVPGMESHQQDIHMANRHSLMLGGALAGSVVAGVL